MIRLFAAIAVPQDIAEGLARRQHGIPGARWRSLDNLHITMRFAGDISEALADDLDAALSVVSGDAFQVTLAGAGSFGDGMDIHAVWAGVEESTPLRRLAARCETAARRARLKPETRAWKPHVTLAYLNRPEPARVAAWLQSHNLMKSPPFRVSSFGLYSSWKTDRGSVYRLERSYALSTVGASVSIART
jgi:2'-5' RNA ligase